MTMERKVCPNIGVIISMMYPTAPMALDAWADVDAAIAAARQSRQNKIERLSTLSSLSFSLEQFG